MSRAVNVLAGFLLLTVLPSPLAQATPASTRSILVNVFDSNGKPISGLGKDSFRVQINGNPVVVVDAKFTVSPRRILVLLDISGSMTGKRDDVKWRLVRQALLDFLELTPPDVPIAFLTFSSQISEVSDFSAGRNAISDWLQQKTNNAPKHRPTALWDAIIGGLKLLEPYQPGDSLYVITDGGDNSSKSGATNTDKMLLGSGTRLFALFFDDAAATEEGRLGRNSLTGLVADSGGVSFAMAGRPWPGGSTRDNFYDFDTPSLNNLKAYTRTLNVQIYGFWTLELAAPSLNKRSKVKLETVNESGQIRKDVWLTYPRVLLPSQ